MSGPVVSGLPVHWPTAPRRRAPHRMSLRLVDRVGELSLLLDEARAGGLSVGLVPTMGALHEGHRSLVRRAAEECDRVVVSIFVNPTQFGDSSDLEHYPRTLGDDLAVLEHEGVAFAFVPPTAELYPSGLGGESVSVRAGGVARRWEGASRPGHFDGVVTVVAKLFAAAGRCRAYFGEKDFQQLAVVRQLARDLAFPVEVVGCPTVREPDGLALSSRNARLSPRERKAATVLWRALGEGERLVADGLASPTGVGAAMTEVLAAEPLATPDYAVVVDPATLETPAELGPGRRWRLLVAASVGRVRLIDNTEALSPPVSPSGSSGADGTPGA